MLKFNKVKGAPNALRIEGLKPEVLEKAAAMQNTALYAEDDSNIIQFGIVNTTGQSKVTNVSLEFNKKDIQEDCLVVYVESSNPEHTIVRAVDYIKALYTNAEKLAKKYDDANALITTI